MLVRDVETGRLGPMNFPVDVVIVVEEPREARIRHLEVVDTVLEFRELGRDLVRHV